MKEMKIEYVYEDSFYETDVLEGKPSLQRMVPVARLEAVDELIAEAVWAMERLGVELVKQEGPQTEEYERTLDFRHSRLVDEWRKRQKVE